MVAYVIAEFSETETGVLLEPVGDAGIEPSAHIFQRLRQVPMVQSHLRVHSQDDQRLMDD